MPIHSLSIFCLSFVRIQSRNELALLASEVRVESLEFCPKTSCNCDYNYESTHLHSGQAQKRSATPNSSRSVWLLQHNETWHRKDVLRQNMPSIDLPRPRLVCALLQ